VTSPKRPPDVRDTDRREPTVHDPSRPAKAPPRPGGGRTPYPVDAPPIDDLPGSEPDYEPGRPLDLPGSEPDYEPGRPLDKPTPSI